jgi:hypothetical protein
MCLLYSSRVIVLQALGSNNSNHVEFLQNFEGWLMLESLASVGGIQSLTFHESFP